MPQDGHERRSYSTKAANECYLTNWISPKRGKHRIGEIKAVAVENWWGTIPRAGGTKAKIRNIMSAIFNHAVRHEWLDKNPITLVRQSAKPRLFQRSARSRRSGRCLPNWSSETARSCSSMREPDCA
jgi:hypothetical protein